MDDDDDEPEDGRDVSLLRADQALIVSGCDHSFPSAGSPGPHTWPHGHGPENHPRAELGAPSEVNSDASQPEVSLCGPGSSGESGPVSD